LVISQSPSSGGSSNNPPYIPGSPDFASSDWQSLAKHYAPLLIVPIVLGILTSIFLTFLNCITCCCPKCCCSAPCCLNSVFAIGVMYTIGFVLIISACVAAWYHAPLFTQGVNIIFDSIASVADDVVNFFKTSKDKIEALTNDLTSCLIPAFNSTAINGTTDSVFQLINETRGILSDMNTTVIKLDSYYSNITNELVFIEDECNQVGITPPILPSDVPSP